MIRAETRQTLGELIRRLQGKGERIAQRRARGLSKREQITRHPWRSAERLWPDLFKD